MQGPSELGARCPDGSHMTTYDDQGVYMDGLIDFLVRPAI